MSPAPAPSATERLRRAVQIVLTIALGAVGGYAFFKLGTPLPWMMGAMWFSIVAVLAGAPLRPPGKLRDVMIAAIGLMVGSAFTPQVIAHAGEWLPSIITVIVYSALMILGLGLLLRRVGGYDPATSFCSAAPGGFAAMVILGGSMGGDMRAVSLMHSVRIVVTVVTIPFWFRLVHDNIPSGTAALGSIEGLSGTDALVLVASALAGYLLARLVRLPLPTLIGPMIVAALVHALDLSTAHPPGEMIALAQIVIGVGVGCRFLGTSLRQISAVLRAAVGMAAVMLVAAILFASGLHLLTGLPFEALILAFAPGGVAEMNVITVALHIDPAFVATHHLVRLAFLLMLAPAAMRLFASRWASLPSSKTEPAE